MTKPANVILGMLIIIGVVILYWDFRTEFKCKLGNMHACDEIGVVNMEISVQRKESEQ
jgi:hypothetical protein